MSNEVNNLAASFVAMAQAFEELPKVKAELEAAKHDVTVGLERIQTLELRLIDRANELEAAHAATRKAEVERDHAETMFLETDDKLNSAKGVLNALMGNASDFLRAVEPPKPEPEPVAEPTPEPTPQVVQSEPSPTEPVFSPELAGASWPSTASDGSAASGEGVASSTTPLGESAVDPIPQPSLNTSASPDGSTAIDAPTATVSDASEVASPSDPTPVSPDAQQVPASLSVNAGESNATTESAGLQPKPWERKPYAGKRYSAWPSYVRLDEWLAGGGTEEAYFA